MRIHAERADVLPELAEWLEARGWPVVSLDETEAEVLVPWEQDEFAAALALRSQIAVWRARHESARVTIDRDVWPGASQTTA